MTEPAFKVLRAIDYDAGVIIKNVKNTDIEVYMYLNQPGVFLSKQGSPVSLELARDAGFDVDALVKEKTMREKIAEATARIREELQMAELGAKMVYERGDFQVLDLGQGRHRIVTKGGEPITREILTKEQATSLVDKLAPEEDTKE